MEKENTVILTGTYTTVQATPTFTKQVLQMNAKDRNGQWQVGEVDVYIKDELVQGFTEGFTLKIKGFLTFNFWNGRSFPKVIVTEILAFEPAQQQNVQAQTQQPQMQQPAGVPPMPGTQPVQTQQPVQQQTPAPQGGIPTPPPMPGVPGM